jgi:Tol biopolymer transport system component
VRGTFALALTLPLYLGGTAALGGTASGGGGAGNAAISGGGRYFAFASAASDLVAHDTNGIFDVFVRDRRRNTTERVSVGPAGAQANGQSGLSAISANGRSVVLWSDASNLVARDTNGVADVFVRDRLQRRTMRASVGPDGKEFDTESGAAAISADGRFVAFSNERDLYVRDLERGVTELVGSGGTPALSADGRYLAFNDGSGHVVVRDRTTDSNEMESVDSAGAPLRGSAEVPTITANGRYVAFLVVATTDMPRSASALYVRDRSQCTTRLVATSVGNPAISADGRTIAFEGGKQGSLQQVVVENLVSGRREVASVSTRGGAANGPSFTGSGPLSFGGRFVAFVSAASNLVAGDDNHTSDAFVRDRQAQATTRVSGPSHRP